MGIVAWIDQLFHVHTLNGFFNLSTWLTAIVGAAVLLLAFHLASRWSGGSRRFAHHRDSWNTS
jgi:hypothetical protein